MGGLCEANPRLLIHEDPRAHSGREGLMTAARAQLLYFTEQPYASVVVAGTGLPVSTASTAVFT